MNLNSFQIRKISSTFYALTGVWIECININRPGWASTDKLSTISQWEDWSYHAQSRREAPPGNELSACVLIRWVFFSPLKRYLRLQPALVPSSAVSQYLTPVHQATLCLWAPPGLPWKHPDRPPSYKSLRKLLWFWKQSSLPHALTGRHHLMTCLPRAQRCVVTSRTVLLLSPARHKHWFF